MALKRVDNHGTAQPRPLNNPAQAADIDAQAIDIGDISRELAIWCFLNGKALRECALWCEDPRATQTWVHFQSLPPKSGARFFIPSPEWAKKLMNEPLSVESIRRWAAPAAQEP